MFHYVPSCSIIFHRFLSCSNTFPHVSLCSINININFNLNLLFIIIIVVIIIIILILILIHHRPSSSIIVNHHQSSSIINHHQSSIINHQSQPINQSINQPKSINQSISHIHYHLLCNPPAGWFLEISRFFWCCHPLLHHPFEHPSMTYCIKTKSAWRFLKNMRSSVGIILPNRWKNKIHCQCTFTVFVEDVYFRCLIVSDSNITMVLICFDHVKAPFCLEKSVGIQGA